MDEVAFYRSARDKTIKDFESWRSKPYICGAGVPTIGYGTTRYPDGRAVTMQDPEITLEQGEQYYNNDIQKIETTLRGVDGFNDMSLAQQAGLTSFAYNVGTGPFTQPTGYETFQAAFKSGNTNQMADAMDLYINKGTKNEAGLRRRRTAERGLMNLQYVPEVPTQPKAGVYTMSQKPQPKAEPVRKAGDAFKTGRW